MILSETLTPVFRQALSCRTLELFLDLGVGGDAGLGGSGSGAGSGVGSVGSAAAAVGVIVGGGNGDIQRLAIREFLFSRYPSEFKSLEEARELSVQPNGVSKSISISHCPGGSGVVIADRLEGSFGFDLEVFSRVRPAISARVSLPGEMAAAPSPAHLWVAKESFFKALPTALEPATISELLINDWQEIEPSVWQFSGESLPTGGRCVGAVALAGMGFVCGIARVLVRG